MRLCYSVAFVVLLSGAACTRSQSTSETAASAAPAPPPKVVVPMAVDVPTFVGYTIEEVRRQLGPPRESQMEPPLVRATRTARKSLRVKDNGWVNTFEINGVTLVVTFNARTRRVRDIVLPGTNEEELLQRGNLTFTAPAYIVLPVYGAQKADDLLGVRVIGRL